LAKLVHGVGINDADYNIIEHKFIDGKWRAIWRCPFYLKWSGVIQRCYSEKWHKNHPKYSDCSAVPEWHYFMTFRAWMEKQDWEGKELDKDLLIPGNRVYGPDTCVFLDKKTNLFLRRIEITKEGKLTGVGWDERNRKFKSHSCDILSGKQKFLGFSDSRVEAHQKWLDFKMEQALILAEQQKDFRISNAIVEYFKNFSKELK